MIGAPLRPQSTPCSWGRRSSSWRYPRGAGARPRSWRTGTSDLARFAWWDPHLLPDLLDGYGRDALTGDDLHVRMPVHLLANAVVLMAEEVHRHTRRIEAAGRFIRIAGARDFSGLTSETK